MRTIVVGTDTSAAADLAVEDAARLARDRGAELVVLYVKGEGADRSVVDPDRAADPSAAPPAPRRAVPGGVDDDSDRGRRRRRAVSSTWPRR